MMIRIDALTIVFTLDKDLGDRIAAQLNRIENVVTHTHERQSTQMSDFGKLQESVAALRAQNTTLNDKVVETNTTLAGLSQRVLDLIASLPPQDDTTQATIDALTSDVNDILAKSKATTDALTAAEDAADDQLPQQG